jgi:hypothetical protein
VLPVASHSVAKTVLQAPAYTAKSVQLAMSDIIRDPAALKKDGFMLATMVQSTIRGLYSWINERLTKDPEQKELRFREAIRTTIREILGLTLNFGVLRTVESACNQLLDRLQGGQYQKATVIKGFDRLGRDLKQLGQSLRHGTPLPTLHATSLTTLEKATSYAFDMQSPLGKWFTQMTQSGFLKGKDPVALMRLTRNWMPISLGSIMAVGLSGFWLEWLTLNKSDAIVTFSKDHLIKKPLGRQRKPKDFNVNEFVSGVQEERWRRNQLNVAPPAQGLSGWFGQTNANALHHASPDTIKQP